jgi:hypothetical protein
MRVKMDLARAIAQFEAVRTSPQRTLLPAKNIPCTDITV